MLSAICHELYSMHARNTHTPMNIRTGSSWWEEPPTPTIHKSHDLCTVNKQDPLFLQASDKRRSLFCVAKPHVGKKLCT